MTHLNAASSWSAVTHRKEAFLKESFQTFQNKAGSDGHWQLPLPQFSSSLQLCVHANQTSQRVGSQSKLLRRKQGWTPHLTTFFRHTPFSSEFGGRWTSRQPCSASLHDQGSLNCNFWNSKQGADSDGTVDCFLTGRNRLFPFKNGCDLAMAEHSGGLLITHWRRCTADAVAIRKVEWVGSNPLAKFQPLDLPPLLEPNRDREQTKKGNKRGPLGRMGSIKSGGSQTGTLKPESKSDFLVHAVRQKKRQDQG